MTLHPDPFLRYGKFKTLAMIKPYTADVYYEQIRSIILAHGFEITNEVSHSLRAGVGG